jgi:hypothetical protein
MNAEVGGSHLIDIRPQPKIDASGAKAPGLQGFYGGLQPRPSGSTVYEMASCDIKLSQLIWTDTSTRSAHHSWEFQAKAHAGSSAKVAWSLGRAL